MTPTPEDYMNFRTIEPETGLVGGTKSSYRSDNEEEPKEDFMSFTELPGSRQARYEGVIHIGDDKLGESKRDIWVTDDSLHNVDRMRARRQPNYKKLFNAIVGGVSTGIYTAVETTGHILDLQNHYQRMMGYENLSTNVLSQWAKNQKEGIRNFLPIYRENPNEIIDFSDPGFYFSALQGIVDSAVGFAIPGMGATKLVGAVQRAARLSGWTNALRTTQAGSQIINSLASGYITNMGEGMIMGVELYENSMENLKEELFQENLEYIRLSNPEMQLSDIIKAAQDVTQQQLEAGKEKEFSSQAGEQADTFLRRNRMFMLTDAIGLHGIYKGAGFTRSLMPDRGVKGFQKRLLSMSSDNLVLQGIKEAGEEIGQNVLQMEGEYQTLKDVGYETDDPETFLKRAYNFATSDQALLEGAMGFFGGGSQRVFTEAVSGQYTSGARARREQQWTNQQEQISRNTAFMKTKLNNYEKAQSLRVQAFSRGEENVAETIKNSQFVILATENFARGTTENLERQLQDIAKGVTEEERIANGWDENYQEQAKEQLEELRRLERSYKRYTRYENQADVFMNRETRNLLVKDAEKIKGGLETIEDSMMSEDETRKGPHLEENKKYLEKQLKIVEDIIKQQDEKYKVLISSESQKAAVAQKKQLAEIGKEAAKARRAKQKSQQQKRKAKDRKEINKHKQKEAKEEQKERAKKRDRRPVDPDENLSKVKVENITEQNQDDNLDISTLSEVEDSTPSVDQVREVENIKQEPHLGEMDADQSFDAEESYKAAERFSKKSDELFDNLEKDLAPERIVPDDNLSKAQKYVRTLEEMIADAAKAKRKEQVEFDDIMKMLLERHGRKRVAPLFNMIQSIWTLANPGKVQNMYTNFEDYLRLSKDEEKELENDDKKAETLTNEQFTSVTEESVKKALKDIEATFNADNNKSFSLEAEYLKVKEGAPILAYLSRLYKQTRDLFFMQRKDTDNYINEEIQDKGILDPKKYPVGTEVTLIVEDNGQDHDNLKVYVDSSTTGQKSRTTWGMKKENWRKNKVLGETERYQELYEEEVPIAVYVGGKKIGYLHETSWINETNVSGDVDKDRAKIKRIRKAIVAKGSHKTHISHRTNGFLWKAADNELITTNEALPDPNMPILVVKNGELHESRNKKWKGTLLNKKPLQEGVSYVILPVGDGDRIAVPLVNKKLSEVADVAYTIRTVLEIFMYNDHSEQAKALVKEIYNATGKNIMTPIGLSEYINMFISLTDTGKTGLLEFTQNNTTDKQMADGFAATFVRGNDLEFEISLGRGVGYVNINRARMEGKSDEFLEILFNSIEEKLGKMYFNTSLDSVGDSEKNVVIVSKKDDSSTTVSYREHLGSATKSAFLGHNIAEKGDAPNYIYTIQPVITLNFTEFDEVQIDPETGKAVLKKKEETSGVIISEQSDVDRLKGKEPLKGKITQSTPTDIEVKKADIERRRQERRGDALEKIGVSRVGYDGKQRQDWKDAKNQDLKIATNHAIERLSKNPNVKIGSLPSSYANAIKAELEINGVNSNDKTPISEIIEKLKEINAKYDAELAALEKPTEQTQESKPSAPDYDEMDVNFDNTDPDSILPTTNIISDLIVKLTDEQVEETAKLNEITEEEGTVKGVIIGEFGSSAKQNQVIDFIRAQVIDKIFLKKRVSKNKAYKEIKSFFEEQHSKANANLEKATKANHQEGIDRFTKAIEELDIILRNWSKLEKLTIKQLRRLDGVKIKEKLEDDLDVPVEEQESTDGLAHHSEVTHFTTPPTDRLAGQLKQFLSGIGAWKEDPNNKDKFIPDRNYFGVQKTMDFMEVYNLLQRITPNLNPSYDEIVKALTESSEAFPFLKEVLVKLENTTDQMRNLFVTGMTNHYVDMKYIGFGRSKTGAFELIEYDSDANSVERVILKDWNGLAIDRLGKFNEDGSDLIVDPALANALIETWEVYSKTHQYTVDDIAGWLGQLGIELTKQTWRDIETGQLKIKGQTITFQQFVENTVLKVLANNLKTRGNTSLVLGGNRFIDEGVVKNLARYDSKYTKNAYSNSHRSGLKTVYSYSLNKFLVNRIRELKEGGYLKFLAKLSFNGQSAWAEALMNDESGFNENFNHWTVSLEAIKRLGSKSKSNKELHNLSEAEIELLKIGMLQADRMDLSGKNQRVIRILYPTASDKTTAMGLTVVAQELSLDMEGNIKFKSIDKLVDLLVLPELQRIKVFQEKTANKDYHLEGYTDGASQFLMFPEMNTLTWRNKEGSFEKMFNEDGSLNADIGSNESMQAIRKAVESHFKSLVDQKLKMWQESGIGIFKNKDGKEEIRFLHESYLNGTTAKGANPIKNVLPEYKVKAAATDMIFQYLIGNAEVHKMFTGDPALYYKKAKVNKNKSKTDPKYNFIADAKATYDNINKRLAADIAPGAEPANADKNKYVQAILADSKSASLVRFEITEILDGKEVADRVRKAWKEYYEETDPSKKKSLESEFESSLNGLVSKKYYSFDGTDAQEYTTWREHLYLMKQYGEITSEQYDEVVKTIEAGNDIKGELFDKVMQPMKPVYVDNVIDEAMDVEKRIYIKSSSFPLLPQLTRGLQLDKLRIAMESKGIDRAAYSTAVKLGGVTNPTNIWNEDGTIVNAEDISFETSSMTLNRKGFRIQQKVPHDPRKANISKVSQASKNLFVNMLDVNNFIFEGKPYNGRDLQTVYHEIYGRLHEIERNKLIKEVGFDPETQSFKSVAALRSMLIKEASERGYAISDQELIELDKELEFLAFSPSSNKYESLLNSIVTSRVIKLKMPGKSFILGSQEGFQGVFEETAEEISKRSGIVFTSAYDPSVGLKPARTENGIRKGSQVIVPWKFKTKDGKQIDITRYIDSNNMIDTSKLPQEMLEIFGMRIPNQGPNSQAYMEIVGFLPEKSGDLIIATRDFVVQMGSDFDIDKLYTYNYSYYIDNDGVIRPHRELTKTNEEDILKNKILDIHLAIHKNDDNKVQSQIVKPLDVWLLGDLANEIDELRIQRRDEELTSQNKSSQEYFTGLSDSYQREKFKGGTAGKDGVSVFSLDSMFNAVSQGKALKYMLSSTDSLKLQIGNKKSDGNLSREYALDNTTFISDIIAGYQSAAVDNAKDPILDKLNINSHTFKVIKILNQLGFGEEVPLILSQDIIIDYVKELERLNSSMSEYSRNKEQTAYNNVIKKYDFTSYNHDQHKHLAGKDATPEQLKNYILLGSKAPNYNQAQIALLDLFRTLDGYGLKIQTLQSTINPDSAGIGKSVIESILKEDQVYALANNMNEHIANAGSLIGEVRAISPEDIVQFEEEKYEIRYSKGLIYAVKPQTINGHAVVKGLFLANDMWRNLFPYDTNVVSTMFEKVEDFTRTSENRVSSKAERRKDIWDNFKSYVFSSSDLGLFDQTITEERSRLLYDKWKEETYVDDNGFTVKRNLKVHDSLGSIILKLKSTHFGMNNPFLSRLDVDMTQSKFGFPTIIKFNASAAEGIDETHIYSAIVDMIVRKDANGVSPSIGVYNGMRMTLRDLAQELILYSYITGGIQEAIQFVKYIPASYLVTMPFTKKLSEISYLDENFGVTPNIDPIIDYYYNVPPFVEQFVQHNPDQIPVIIIDDIKERVTDVDKLVSFSLKTGDPELLQRIGKPISVQSGVSYVSPLYVSIRNDKAGKGYNLYKYSLKDKVYKQIDTLGSFGNDEYNSNVSSQRTLIKRNAAKVSPEERTQQPVKNQGNPLGEIVDGDHDMSTISVETEDTTDTQQSKAPTIQKILEGTLEAHVRQDGKEAMKELLNEIMNASNDPYLAALAQEVFEYVDYLPDSFRIEFTNRVNAGVGGRYILAAGDKNLTPHSVVINVRQLKDQGQLTVIETILHELFHGFTGYKIALYLLSKKDNIKQLKQLLENSPKLALSEKEKQIISSIELLFNYTRNAIKSDRLVGNHYLEFMRKHNSPNRKNEIFNDFEIGSFYGFTDLMEFVSMVSSNKEFAKILNNIPSPDKKTTVLQKIRQKLTELFKSIMGFDVKKGNVYSDTIQRIFELMEASIETGNFNEGVTNEELTEVEAETLTFKENETYYKFEVKNGIPVNGWYSQGNPNNYRELNKKNLIEIYHRLVDKPLDTTKKVDPKAQTDKYQLKLSNGKIITFNDQQISAMDAIEEWFNSGEQFFTLSGFAGTGKTTIIKKAIEGLLGRGPIVVSAPTHKAKRVIADTTGMVGKTIHSLLNIKPNLEIEDLDPENLEFARDKNARRPPEISLARVVIIDEASMLNKAMVKMIIQDAKRYNTKVIFMGDQAQIPPIGELMSEVFTSSEIKHRAHLDKVERQADGNPLFKVYDAIRNNLSSAQDMFDHITKLNDKGEGILFTSDNGTFAKKVIDAFTSAEYQNDSDSYKLIAYTNTGVNQWNNLIRKARMPEAKVFIEKGDILMGYRTIMTEDDIIIENAADYKVMGRSELKVSSDGINGYIVSIGNIYENNEKDIFVVDRTTENLNKYRRKLNELKQQAIQNRSRMGGSAWIPYFQFKENYVLFDDVMNEDGSLAAAADLKYGYAVTAHKAQGSTYGTVFVDENNIDMNQFSQQRHVTDRIKKGLKPLTKEDVDTERNKIKYVALSRPSKNAVVLSRKAKSDKNSYSTPVQKPDWDVDVTLLGDSDTEGNFPDATQIGTPESLTAEQIVPNNELEEFMKHCKG